jgi:N-acetylmuramoyl-L-alanine amidase
MTSDQYLHRGKAYKIPILIYPYNGTSIRSSIGNDDWDRAIRIQSYNEQILKKGLRKTHFRESKILWVPYHELHCTDTNTDQMPAVVAKGSKTVSKTATAAKAASATTLNEPLFGDEYATFTKDNNSLKGQVFYVVAGHGGPDPGAVAQKVSNKYTLCEDEYAYDVSLRLTRQLMKRGAKVHMIIEDKDDGIRDEMYFDCDQDETCNDKRIPRGQLDRLKQRADHINVLYSMYKKKGITDQKVICIHVDSRAEHKRQDVFFYYYGKSRSGKKLASNLHNTFNEKYQKYQSNRGYHGTLSARPLYMLRRTNAPAVYVELANIRNSKDRERLIKQENREALAKWLADGLSK